MKHKSATIARMLNLWRRHTPNCPHRAKGRDYCKCQCPIWTDGELNGKRYRRGLKVKDWQRAIRKLAILESPESTQLKPVPEAVKAFAEHHNYLEASTLRKYKNILDHIEEFAEKASIGTIAEFTIERLDQFRYGRGLARTTSTKELQTLRQFFSFCLERKWIGENIAKKIRPPKNVKPEEVEPYSPKEVALIIGACLEIGRTSYERLRARAMILLLRYTGLRISDVATLARDRIRDGQILLHTQKTGGTVYLPIPDELAGALAIVPDPRGSGSAPEYFFWNGITSRRAVVGIAERTMAAVFKKSTVAKAHAHRFRHYAESRTMPNAKPRDVTKLRKSGRFRESALFHAA